MATCSISKPNKSEREPPDWPARCQDSHLRPIPSTACWVLRAISEKKNKKKSEELHIYSRRNSFHLWYTKYLQSHAEDCLHGETGACVFCRLTSGNHKSAARSPPGVSQIPAGMAERKKKKEARNNSPAATERVTREDVATEEKKHTTECTKPTRGSLTPWHSSHENKKNMKIWKKDAWSDCIWGGRVHSTKSQLGCVFSSVSVGRRCDAQRTRQAFLWMEWRFCFPL